MKCGWSKGRQFVKRKPGVINRLVSFRLCVCGCTNDILHFMCKMYGVLTE
jgi:hypothetical protein